MNGMASSSLQCHGYVLRHTSLQNQFCILMDCPCPRTQSLIPQASDSYCCQLPVTAVLVWITRGKLNLFNDKSWVTVWIFYYCTALSINKWKLLCSPARLFFILVSDIHIKWNYLNGKEGESSWIYLDYTCYTQTSFKIQISGEGEKHSPLYEFHIRIRDFRDMDGRICSIEFALRYVRTIS